MKIKFAAFIISGLVLAFIPAFLFTPVTDTGDAAVYINYASELSGEATSLNFITRAPLYPFFLSFIIKTAGITALPRTVLVFQYFLNFITSVLLAATLKDIMTRRSACLSAILFYIGFSTVYYGYMILTETMTVFLMMVTVYIFTRWIGRESNILLSLTGTVISLLVLSRFNTLPLIFTFAIMILLIPWIRERRVNILKTGRQLLWFLLPVVVILNGYSLLNYSIRGFYGLFPTGGSPCITRNAVIATIDGTENISQQNIEVHRLLLEGKESYYSQKIIETKGSMTMGLGIKPVRKLYSGYQTYLKALPGLCEYFNLDPSSPEPGLSKMLAPYYREVIKQNRTDLWMMRILSLLNSFRSSSGIIIPAKDNVNLNRLPGFVIIIYKVLVLIAAGAVFLCSIFWVLHKILGKHDIDPAVLSLILLFLSFYFINFIFATSGDANRYKFPSEPLMTGLGIYFLKSLSLRLKTMNRQTF